MIISAVLKEQNNIKKFEDEFQEHQRKGSMLFQLKCIRDKINIPFL
jgi:hypothetical protein